MHPQLQRIADELQSATDRLQALVSSIPEHLWTQRPGPDRWSVAECVSHLNLTSASYLPLLDSAVAEAAALGAAPPRRYRRDFVGWLLWRIMGPPVRMRTRTAAPFVPTAETSVSELVQEFERLQAEQVRRVERADGLAIDRVRLASPFDPRVKYNLYACLSILPRHQHRHLWQAEQVGRSILSPPAATAR